MALGLLPEAPVPGIGGAGPAGVTKPGYDPVDSSAAPFFPNAAGDIWKIDLRWQLPNLVGATNTLFYRQTDEVPAGEDPGSYLVRLLVAEDDTPVHKYLAVCASSAAVVCCVVNNQSVANDFTQVYDISNRMGLKGGDLLSPQAAVQMIIQDVDFRKKGRKTIYWPGLDESSETDGHLVLGEYGLVVAAFTDMEDLNGLVAGGADATYFQLVFGQVPADSGNWVTGAGVHPGTWIIRQKGRDSALC